MKGRALRLLIGASLLVSWRAVGLPGTQAGELHSPASGLERLSQYLSRAEAFGFAGAVLVASGDSVLLSDGYGWSDSMHRVPITPRTMFDIGSLSKQFTAAAILTLVDDGLLHVDDRLDQFFEDVPVDKQGITLHQLLTHTSGLPRESGIDFEDISGEEFVRRLLEQPLLSAPGERFSYSNAGYSLLAQVVARVTGQSFTRYVHERLFDAAGLTRTGFDGEDQWSRDDVARAVGGELDGASPLDWPLRPGMMGQGSVLTTVEDLRTWIEALETGKVLSPVSMERMFTPQVDDYGYGWGVRQTEHGSRAAHTGVWYAFSSSLHWYRDENLIIIALSNREIDWIKLASVGMRQAEWAVFGDGRGPLPPTVAELDSAALARFVGEYELASGGRLSVGLRSGALQLTADSQPGFDVLTPRPDTAVEPAAPKELNRRVAEVWDETRQGRFDGLERLVSPSRRDAYAELLQRYWAERADSLGAFVSARVLGTLAPYGTADAQWTYVQSRFEHGDDTAYLWWWSDGLVHGFVRGASLPEMVTTFRPVGHDEFVSFNLWSETQRRIRFRGVAHGCMALEVVTGGAFSPTAERCP